MSERRIVLQGATNFRDIGGYGCADGSSTRWRRVYRSDRLDRLTPGDVATLDQLGLCRVFDLRTDQERRAAPDAMPSVHLPVLNRQSGTRAAAEKSGRLTPARALDGEIFLRDLYLALIDGAASAIGGLLGALGDLDGAAVVIHCTGGKDRTGIVVALLLELLGVDRPTILDDYELTSRYRLPIHQGGSVRSLVEAGMAAEVAAGVLGTPRWAMAAALERLTEVFGGAEPYLRGPGGMSAGAIAALRSTLTTRQQDHA
jgi:protein-tyrosine phosphatase